MPGFSGTTEFWVKEGKEVGKHGFNFSSLHKFLEMRVQWERRSIERLRGMKRRKRLLLSKRLWEAIAYRLLLKLGGLLHQIKFSGLIWFCTERSKFKPLRVSFCSCMVWSYPEVPEHPVAWTGRIWLKVIEGPAWQLCRMMLLKGNEAIHHRLRSNWESRSCVRDIHRQWKWRQGPVSTRKWRPVALSELSEQNMTEKQFLAVGTSECPGDGQVTPEVLPAVGVGQTWRTERIPHALQDSSSPKITYTSVILQIRRWRGQNSDKCFPDSSKQKLGYVKRWVELASKTELAI